MSARIDRCRSNRCSWSVWLSFASLPALQSGFRPGYSTETAVLFVLSDILMAVDHGDLAALILLDDGGRPLIQWTTISCYNVWKWALVSPTSLSSGYNRTWSDGYSRPTYDMEMPSQPSSRLCVQCHRVSLLTPYCSLCTLSRWHYW